MKFFTLEHLNFLKANLFLLISCDFAIKIFGCPRPGIMKGNLSNLPASKEVEESKQSFLWFPWFLWLGGGIREGDVVIPALV